MSACKTGCGVEAQAHNDPFCINCGDDWAISQERRRWLASGTDVKGPRRRVALVDFINRTRAERQNGGQHVDR